MHLSLERRKRVGMVFLSRSGILGWAVGELGKLPAELVVFLEMLVDGTVHDLLLSFADL